MIEPTTEPLVPDGQTVGSLSAEAAALAGAAIRDYCGWHIAPVITTDLILDSDGGRVLHLPTLRLLEVLLVEDLTGPAPRPITDFRHSQAGMLSRAAGWPQGFSAVRVQFRHGFETLPDGLLPVLNTVGARRVKRESLGRRSVELDDYEAQLHHRVLDRYRIENLP